MRECSKSIARRLSDPDFTRRYFRGRGIDVGGRPDPLALYTELFPLIESIRTWDREDGDGQKLEGVADASLDFVHSSHCLEHLEDPGAALSNWLRVLRPGGHLIAIVPDEDLYEQGEFPSTFNAGHRWTFTILKERSWSPRSRNLLDLIRELGPGADLQRIQLLTGSYRFSLPRYDQTLTPIGECGIEFVVRRRPPEELEAGGRLPRGGRASRELRVHLNQYREDAAALKRANAARVPFEDDSEI